MVGDGRCLIMLQEYAPFVSGDVEEDIAIGGVTVYL